ncbi:MAG: hypothetical protein K2O40_12145, partial [Lachnospiraceae bacterium]|nr:hypothetical protein [Lachnospiraceae bacterium]
ELDQQVSLSSIKKYIHIEAVKDSICLYSTEQGTNSGKTGTEKVNGQNTNIPYPISLYLAHNYQADLHQKLQYPHPVH